MFNVGDKVQVIDPCIAYPQLFTKIGIVTEAIPPNTVVDVAMYDVHIENEVYVLYHDEIQKVENDV